MGWPHLATEEAMKYWFWMGMPTLLLLQERKDWGDNQNSLPGKHGLPQP